MKRSKGKPRILTPIEEIQVHNMHKQGKPIAEIAYKFKISPSTVSRTVIRLKQQSSKENES